MDTKEVNSLSSALLESLNTISKANTSTGTLTIEARIKEVVDEGIGIYKVQYLENTFEATSASTDINYNVDEMVYVLVPNGDFGKNKIIIASVNSNKSTFASTQGDNIYIPLGDNLLNDINELNLYSYRNTPLTSIDIDLINYKMIAALNDSRTFALQCKIKTNIDILQRNRGNYGLRLDIPCYQEGTEIIYPIVLDINNLQGDPYDYEVYSDQICYFTIPDSYELDDSKNASLYYFVSDFVLQDDTKPADIWIKDISLVSCLEMSKDNMNGYHVQLLASGGNTFYGNYIYETKVLSPTIYLNGKVTNTNNFECYWFRENAAVGTSHDKYHRLGGVGWEILNAKTNTSTEAGGSESFRYVTNVYTYSVRGADFLIDTKYKCVLVKNNISYEGEVTLRIIESPLNIEIFTNKPNNVFIENIGQATVTVRCLDKRGYSDNVTFSYVWKRFDKFGNVINDSALEYPFVPDRISSEGGYNTYEGSITFDVANIDKTNKIMCSIFNIINTNGINEEILLGTKSITLNTEPSTSFNIIVSNGDKLYKYDADGDSPLVANYDGPATSALTSITPISIRLYKLDGTEFTDAEYAVITVEWLFPQNSMITIDKQLRTDSTTNPGYWTIKGSYNSLKSFSYSIVDVFDKNKVDNTVIIRSYFKNDKADNVANIRFLKDGESGTNGTKYSAIITYNNVAYGEKDVNGLEQKLQLFYVYEEDTWYSYNPAVGRLIPIIPSTDIIATLNTVLYSDGVRVSDNDTDWGLFDSSYGYGNIVIPIEVDSNGNITLLPGQSWIDETFVFTAIVEARVKAKRTSLDEDSFSNSDEYVYAYYPIETIYVEKMDYLRSIMPSLKGGFSTVEYASDGTNPQYDSSNPFEMSNSINNIDIRTLYEYEWNASQNLAVKPADDTITCKVTPTSKFDNGVSRNYLRVGTVPKAGTQEYYNRYVGLLEDSLEDSMNRLSYYENLQNAMSVFDKFDYDEMMNTISSFDNVFEEKGNLARAEQEMMDKLIEIKNWLIKEKDGVQVLEDYYDDICDMIADVTALREQVDQLGYEHSALTFLINAEASEYELNLIVGDSKVISVLNNRINAYNQIVNNVYGHYQELIDNAFISQTEGLEDFINNTLIPFTSDDRWDILIGSYLSS